MSAPPRAKPPIPKRSPNASAKAVGTASKVAPQRPPRPAVSQEEENLVVVEKAEALDSDAQEQTTSVGESSVGADGGSEPEENSVEATKSVSPPKPNAEPPLPKRSGAAKVAPPIPKRSGAGTPKRPVNAPAANAVVTPVAAPSVSSAVADAQFKFAAAQPTGASVPAPRAVGSPFQVARIKCETCAKTVYETEKLLADGRIFHKGCFRCKECNGVMKV